MSVKLTSELEQIVRSAVDNGSYKNETEVVCAALRLLQERQRRTEASRSEIQPALNQLDRGEGE